MTPTERQLIMSLVVVPPTGAEITPEEFLHRTGATDAQALTLRYLREAVEERNVDDVDLALVVAGTFGTPPEALPLLVELANTDWHHKHEDVATALQDLHDPASVEALVRLATWYPPYLDYDEGHALARKAVWALGAIPDPTADQALITLINTATDFVRRQAAKQLARRHRST